MSYDELVRKWWAGRFPDADPPKWSSAITCADASDLLRWHDAQKKWVIVANGEGAAAKVIAGSAIEQAVHDFMCCCGHDWENCGTPHIILDIRGMADPDNWALDERGERYSVDWQHETGSITIYKLSAVSKPELPELSEKEG